MASPSSSNPHPRRVLVTGLGLKTNTLFNKGSTFHSPTSLLDDSSSFYPPHLYRAQSNLDDVADANRRRVAMTLESISKTLSNISLSDDASSTPSSSSNFFADRVLPVPQGILSHTIVRPLPSPPSPSERRMLQPRSVQRNRHASDSGLGSSVASSSSVKTQHNAGKATRSTTALQATAVTRSAAAASTGAKPAGLSPRATNRIYEHTVKPLLAKPDFKPFHPILLECTTKINKKDIVCLRDLEKTIFLLAPERTKVAKLYLAFCIESVRCLQATVDYLSDREQTRSSDAPYTAGYFIDLVEQIHRYAQQLADVKEKEKSGNSIDTMDFHSTDQIKLHGGIAVNGRPAELVRISRDGRAVSIATGLPVELEEDSKDAIRIKRSASQEREDEEEIMRSMARRKKNAPPEEYAPKMCSVPGCTKEFKRPCDLTKHEKTHSRPWKCPLPSCKYHDYGWPTEKEKDRHLNDKHSDNPPMYECLFKPCTYKSKRDSNRKQHMEKTHGWKYIRTKTNGSSKMQSPMDITQVQLPSASSASPARPSLDAGSSTNQPTPQLVNMPTPVSTMSPNIATPPLDEFSLPLYDNASALAQLNFPTCTPSDIMGGMNIPTEMNDVDFAPLEMDNGGFSGFDNFGNEATAYASPSNSSSLDNNSAYQDIGQDMTMYEDIYSAPMQLPMPESTVFGNNYSTDSKSLLSGFLAAAELCVPMVTPAQQQQIAHLQMLHGQAQQQQEQQRQARNLMSRFSPLGEGNTMLYTPPDSMAEDEGFPDFQSESSKKGLDFVLFPPAQLGQPKAAEPVFNNTFTDMTPSLAAGYSQPNSQIYSNMDW